MTSSTEPKLLIDLTNARQATALNVESILHRSQIEDFLNRVNDVVGRVKAFKGKLKQGGGCARSVSYERYHDVITLHGKRGSGKTTFLLSALELLQTEDNEQKEFRDTGRENLKNLCVLEVLDPTLFGLHEHLLLSLLAKIAAEVTSAVKNSGRSLACGPSDICELEKWRKSLSQFAKSLKHMGETRDDLDGDMPKETVHWDDAEFIFEQNMESAKRSFGLEREFHNFLNDSLQLIGKDAFVLALDDIDTRPQIGWHVLEVLRRYFTSPQLVVVLSGDMDLFKTIIEKQQLRIFDLNFDSSAEVRNEFKTKVDGLTEQYLLKILRTPSRINLGSFQSALQQWARTEPTAVQKIGKSGQSMQLEVLLKRSFFPLLACIRGSEQRLFKQTLFANPARTVTQVLDVLWEISIKYTGHQAAIEGNINEFDSLLSPGVCEPAVGRMREVFLISLQNIGIGRPFDFAETLQASHGVNQLMKRLFERGYVTTGLDLLPNRQNPDENNALLALNAKLTQVMRSTPSFLVAYIFKACLLREVLLRKHPDIDPSQYKKYEHYLGLEVEELPSVTASRVAALHWGEPKNNGPLQAMGMVRLYGSSITKNAPTAVRSMYGVYVSELQDDDGDLIPNELLGFCHVSEKVSLYQEKALRRWINTPETLSDSIFSWQCGFTGLGIVDVSVRDNAYRAFSVFPLLAAMSDFLEQDEKSIQSLFSQYSQVLRVNAFSYDDGSPLSESEYDDEKEDVVADEGNGSDITNKNFLESLRLWSRLCKKLFLKISAPTVLCANIMKRYFYALARIDANISNESIFVGSYLHRCLIAFFNSVLVEEFLLSDERESAYILLDNPATVDDVFLKNIFSSGAIIECEEKGDSEQIAKLFAAEFKQYKIEKGFICDRYPMFKSVFTCPLWGLYLNPGDGSECNIANSVYEIYIQSQQQHIETVKTYYGVVYGESSSSPNFLNMYHLLNSLAIPKFIKSEPRVILETRTDVGRSLGLPLNPRSIKRKAVINSNSVRPRLLSIIEESQDEIPSDFHENYCSLVEYLYKDEIVIQKLTESTLAEDFWAYIKKNVKP